MSDKNENHIGQKRSEKPTDDEQIDGEPVIEISDAEIASMIEEQAEPGPAMPSEYNESANSEEFEHLCDEIVRLMRRLKIPGVAVGILNGNDEQTAGLGITNVENPLPVTADTLFQIGSITKTVTCTAIMRLVEEGKLSLDIPIRAYLPDLRLQDGKAAEQVTLRHLLTHTAGWEGDYFDDTGTGDDALAKMVTRLDRLAQLTSPGTVYSYNNAGFYLVGRLLEIAAGKPYEAVVKELLLNPLQMNMSFFFPGDMMTYRVASGHEAVYKDENKGPEVARPWGLARAGNAIGGLVSTVKDLLQYARFHMGGTTSDEKQLLKPATLELMQMPQVKDGQGESVGLSWFIREVDGITIIRHGGATNGQMASLQIVPSHHFAFVFLTNSDRGSELYTQLGRWLLEHYLGIIDKMPSPIPASTGDLAQFEGSYSALATEIHMKIKDSDLILEQIPKGGFPTADTPASPPPPPVRVALFAPDHFVALDEPEKDACGEFLRNPDGSIAWLRFGGRLHAKENKPVKADQ